MQEVPAANNYYGNIGHTNAVERRRCLQAEKIEHCLVSIATLERKLNIITCWEPHEPMYKDAEKKVKEREYMLAVNNLEGLVVARLFELVKMNHGGTGTISQDVEFE